MRMLVVVALGCVALFSKVSAAQPTTPPPCESKPEWIQYIQNLDDGWKIDFVGEPQSAPHLARLLTSQPGFVEVEVTENESKRKFFKWTDVIVDTCKHSAELKTEYLRVTHVYAYAVEGKVFAYGVYGVCGHMEKSVWIGAGCETGLMITDTTGSGKFDSLQFGRWTPSTVPDWVHKAVN